MLRNAYFINSEKIIENNPKKSMKPSPEVFLHNRLDKDVQRIIYPINLMLKIFFTSKYIIRDDYITPKRNSKFIILIVVAMFISYGFFIFNMMSSGPDDYEKMYSKSYIFYLFLFYYVFYTIGFIMLFVLNAVHSESNISLILIIQNINSSIDFSKDIGSFVFWNWVSVFSICGLNMFMYILYYVLFDHFNFVESCADWMFITFDVNLICAVRFIILLEKYLVVWKETVLMDNEECDCIKMFVVYQNILEAYNLYKKVFQLLILFHTIDTFFRSLSYFNLLLNLIQSPLQESVFEVSLKALKTSENLVLSAEDISSKITAGVILIVWLLKDILIVIIQSILCEKFYIAVEEAESAGIEILKNNKHSGNADQLCNNVILANRTSFSKMTACGLFDIDATLPIHFMGLLTTYVIALLQITFL